MNVTERTVVLSRLLRRIEVSDPGRVRLRNAGTAALSVSIAIAVMAGISVGLHRSMELVTVCGFMAMEAAVMVKDASIRERKITTVLLVVPAVAAASVAAVAGRHWAAEDVGFVLVVFVAVWVRRYGPRGTACGMIGFFAYFFGLLTHGTVDGLLFMILAIVVGVGSALFVRTALLPERPRDELRRLGSALRAASTGVLDAVCEEYRSAGRLRRRLDEFAETAMAVDDWQGRFETPRHVDVPAQELTERVFEAQITIEQTASALWALGPREAWPGPLRRAMAVLRATLTESTAYAGPAEAGARRAAAGSTAESTAEPTTAEAIGLPGPAGVAAAAVLNATEAQYALRAIRIRAEDQVPDAVGAAAALSAGAGEMHDESAPASTPAPENTQAQVDAPAAGGAPAEDARPAGRWEWHGWNPATRAAIQTTVAAAVATVLGDLISADRWYWAVLTSFMVFYGTTTRGEILSRAWRRVSGTLAGVAAALVVVFVVGHHPPVQLMLIIVCVFLAFYLGPLSYAVLTFFITVLLASLYELLGVLNLKVLEWRVEETLMGAVVGIAAAYLIMSTRSAPRLVERIADYLAMLEDVVGRCAEMLLTPVDDHRLVPMVRELDTALGAVMTAAEPLESVGTLRHRGDARRWRRQLQMNSRSARLLVHSATESQRTGPAGASAATERRFRAAAVHVRERIESLRGRFAQQARIEEAARRIPRNKRGRSDRDVALAGDADTETVVLNVLDTLPAGERGPAAEGAMSTAVRGLSRINRTLPTIRR